MNTADLDEVVLNWLLLQLTSRSCITFSCGGGAERALLAVLELDPNHPEAQRNLAVLRRQQKPG